MSDNAWMMIVNTVKLACFTGLAIAFDRWWIVFFAIIFWTYVE